MAMMGSGSARGENRAREAAEAAVSSPLLEDVNLSGRAWPADQRHRRHGPAHQRVQQVGDTVKQYASEDANVVVGCVIDPEMSEEIRVTVVATGIGRPASPEQQPQQDGAPHDGDRGWPQPPRADARRPARADLHPQPARSACRCARAGGGRRADAPRTPRCWISRRSCGGRRTEATRSSGWSARELAIEHCHGGTSLATAESMRLRSAMLYAKVAASQRLAASLPASVRVCARCGREDARDRRMLRQRTLKNTIRATGVGLHSGKKVLMVLRPAPVDTGVVFRRTDLDEPVDVRAYAENVGDTMLGTTLDARRVRVVDHRAPVVGVRRPRARQRVRRPVGGRSADHGRQRRPVRVPAAVRRHRRAARAEAFRARAAERIEVQDGDKWARFDPYDGFKVNFEIEFDHPIFKKRAQSATMDFSTTSFLKEISRARTFGFMRDLEYLRSKNLALGGTHGQRDRARRLPRAERRRTALRGRVRASTRSSTRSATCTCSAAA